MRIFSKIRRTKGIVATWETMLRLGMVTKETEEKVRILLFWEKHGLEATLDAFPAKRRTLFDWKKKLKEADGKINALAPKSRAPQRKRKRVWDGHILDEIRRLRQEHPNLGKEKLQPLLMEFCRKENLPCPAVCTVGRLIMDLGGLRKTITVSHFGKKKQPNRQTVLRKPRDFKAKYPGHCVALDTIEEFQRGLRRYIVTAEDLFGRFSFAWGTSSHASEAAKEFFSAFQKVFPFPITFVLTDNGSEWKKEFAMELARLAIVHYHTYPRTPKMNSHIERFNRTIQEEFSNWHRDLLFADMPSFNRKLMAYLVWYNTKRVHWAFKNKLSPMQFLLSLNQNRLPEECKRGCAYTLHCNLLCI